MNTINYYYTPQKREHVIFIGNRKGLKNYHPKPILLPSQYNSRYTQDQLRESINLMRNFINTNNLQSLEE